jgi:hypothetical protein
LGGLGTMLLYNKLPILNRVKNRWARFFLKAFIFIFPSQIGSIWVSLKGE